MLGVAGSQVGPTAKAWANFLHYNLGLSWVKVSRLLARLGVAATAGALCQASVHQACTDLVPVHQGVVKVQLFANPRHGRRDVPTQLATALCRTIIPTSRLPKKINLCQCV